MSKDTDNNYINTLDPILRSALKSLDLLPETEVERYERFKNMMANLATGNNNIQIIPTRNPESQLQIKTEAITKKHSSSGIKLPSFGNKVANADEANSQAESKETIPSDYFESSENLLQSLKEEKSKPNSSQDLKSLKGVQENLLTPFGIGSFLMLLCTGGLLLGYLGWNNLLNAESASNVQNIKEDNKSIEDSQNKTEIAAPVSLDLETISSLKPNSNPFISAPATNPTNNPSQSVDKSAQSVEVTRSGADLASALLPASLRSERSQVGINYQNASQNIAQNNNTQVGQIPISSSLIKSNTLNIAPIPVPAPPPPKNSKGTNPPQRINQVKFFGDYYYVLVPNNNANSLTGARKVVKDAYLAQFPQGVRIQMGAFDNQEDAQDLLKRLKQEGITGEIYRSK